MHARAETEPDLFDDAASAPGDEAAVLALYQAQGVAAGTAGLEGVTEEQVARFHEQGYLVVHDAFTPDEVAAALAGLLDLIDGQHPGFTRGIQFEAGARALLPTLPRERKQDAVRKLMRFVDHDPRLRAMAGHPRLLATLERLIGEPPALFQDQALLKPPLLGREKPWHQDNAYFNLPPAATVVGVWIALDEATPENGCMHLIPGSHRRGPVVHFKRRDWQICDTDVATGQVVAVPLQPGGCLLFHGLLHHGTPPSRSPRRRRAVQFHYKPVSLGGISAAERLAVFGSEGKDVTC
jgi:phytanoyl-CoA hydroxylase